MELRGKYVFLSEGVRGSLAKQVIAKYDLSKGHCPQKFGLGMKEIWEIDPRSTARAPSPTRWAGPLARRRRRVVHLSPGEQPGLRGFVVHLKLRKPPPLPYMEFQRFKQHHPMVAELLKGGKRVAYGARAISEGGWQSIPKMVAPFVALLAARRGASSTSPASSANHNAMLSGKAAAEAAHAAITAGRAQDELTAYETEVRSGPIGKDLKKVRNVKPLWSRYGLVAT